MELFILMMYWPWVTLCPLLPLRTDIVNACEVLCHSIQDLMPCLAQRISIVKKVLSSYSITNRQLCFRIEGCYLRTQPENLLKFYIMIWIFHSISVYLPSQSLFLGFYTTDFNLKVDIYDRLRSICTLMLLIWPEISQHHYKITPM